MMREAAIERLLDEIKKGKVERRGYQLWIISSIIKARRYNRNVLIELDAGMGKRIITYLVSRIFRDDKILIITPSRVSVWDTVMTFRELSGGDSWFGAIVGGMPKGLKIANLRKRVTITTPISLARLIEKHPELVSDVEVVIINEIDKVLRRICLRPASNIDYEHAGHGEYVGILSYPWNILKTYLPQTACWIGMSGTLRDEHYLYATDGVRVKKELETLLEVLYPKKNTVIITMDTIIERTDAREYIVRNLTLIRPIPVEDENVRILVDAISREMSYVIENIRDYSREIYPEESTPFETKEKIIRTISVLPHNNPLKIKFLRLALARRHIFANTPQVYRRFLSKPMFRRIIRKYHEVELDEIIPKESAKLRKIVEICSEWLATNQKANIVILTSFVKTAIEIWKKLKDIPADTYILTGRTFNKKAVIEKFKRKKPSILILTPVAERDLDFPQASLVIIHDVISTTKSMYQRIKRARRSLVLILYYEDTFEEKKVNILLSRILRRYPWSIRVLT